MTRIGARSGAGRGSWGTYALLPERPGLPGWAAVLCALGFTALGVFADLERLNRLGLIFQVCYFLGCLIAVVMVQRRALFAPMVQPPLILALAVPGVVLVAGSPPQGEGVIATALALGTPLINGFPTMAVTTAVTVAVGFIRMIIQRGPGPRLPRHATESGRRSASASRA